MSSEKMLEGSDKMKLSAFKAIEASMEDFYLCAEKDQESLNKINKQEIESRIQVFPI